MTKKLLAGVKRGNRKAQKEFYDKYSVRMFKLAYRYVNNETDADSIVNYGFFKIFSNLDKFIYKEERSLIAWMKKIIINEALGFLRQNTLFSDISEIEKESVISNVNENNLDLETYYCIIKNLPDDYRTVFNLHAIEGYSHKEISEKLDIKTSSSRVYLTRARKLLQEKLNKNGE
ncbi:MAG: RNA polymerase sigma factor [Bacteroidales bacterium]|nr:RNA polymerase sigma factor [Bacteroidales bacterium]